MLKGKALIKETDMPEKMQTQAMDSASQALDLYDVSDCISIAAHIKKHCIRAIGGVVFTGEFAIASQSFDTIASFL
ncbi:hypothetical protein V6N13_091725 [Hibiscus sabdariffa]|uniref:Dynein light chain n=1 Tax=Hibiscus sabdariffa TaxID=183260 RepID=A0ABR2QF62_9ROSI